MTPLKKALAREKGEIDYCDECLDVRIVNGVGYCGISEKLLHPLMLERGQGYGPARRCKERDNARGKNAEKSLDKS